MVILVALAVLAVVELVVCLAEPLLLTGQANAVAMVMQVQLVILELLVAPGMLDRQVILAYFHLIIILLEEMRELLVLEE